MNENLKKRLPIIGIAAATIILAGIAVFTATRIFRSREGNVSPVAPEEDSLAQAPTATATLTPTVTPTPTIRLTGSPTPTPRVSVSPTASISATLTPTKKPTATPTSAETLPDAGISFPTVIGVSVGLILVIASILLAI